MYEFGITARLQYGRFVRFRVSSSEQSSVNRFFVAEYFLQHTGFRSRLINRRDISCRDFIKFGGHDDDDEDISFS